MSRAEWTSVQFGDMLAAPPIQGDRLSAEGPWKFGCGRLPTGQKQWGFSIAIPTSQYAGRFSRAWVQRRC